MNDVKRKLNPHEGKHRLLKSVSVTSLKHQVSFWRWVSVLFQFPKRFFHHLILIRCLSIRTMLKSFKEGKDLLHKFRCSYLIKVSGSYFWRWALVVQFVRLIPPLLNLVSINYRQLLSYVKAGPRLVLPSKSLILRHTSSTIRLIGC